MSRLRECEEERESAEERKSTEESAETRQARVLAGVAAYTPSNNTANALHDSETLAVDLVEFPPEFRKIIMEALVLIHLLSCKRQRFRVPDPKTARRMMMDGEMLARTVVVVEQLCSIVSALFSGLEYSVELDEYPRPSRMLRNTPQFRIILHEARGKGVVDRTERIDHEPAPFIREILTACGVLQKCTVTAQVARIRQIHERWHRAHDQRRAD